MDRFEGHEDADERVAGIAGISDSQQHGICLKVIEHRIRNLIALAHRLESIEAGVTPVCANYYQALVRNLTRALSQDVVIDVHIRGSADLGIGGIAKSARNQEVAASTSAIAASSTTPVSSPRRIGRSSRARISPRGPPART